MPKVKIIISGGGTGGHIFPAIAIANALKEKLQDVEFLFVGAKGRMEMEKVPAAGYRIEPLWISGLQRRLTIENLSFPLKVISSLIRANKLINEFKPHVVVGTGGFASGPVLRVAARKGIPTLIQEQNSFPGITNRLLSKQVTKICVAYPNMGKYFPKSKIVITGNPVRKDIAHLEGKKKPALAFFNLTETKKTVLVIGGSLGARTINESILLLLDELIANNIQLIWQTGKTFYEKAKEAADKYEGKGVSVHAFITQMDFAYAAADVVVSRAGALSVSEISLASKPAIFIPSPNVSEDHQTKNAMMLVNQEAAILIKDAQAKEQLGSELFSLLKKECAMNNLRLNITKLAYYNAADAIANEVIQLIKK